MLRIAEPSSPGLLIRLGILAVLVLSLCAACTETGSQPTLPTAGEAQTLVCQAVAGLGEAIQGLSTMNERTGIDDLLARKQAVDRAVEALKRANSVFNDPRVNDLVTSYESLSRTLDQAGASQNVAQAAGAVRAAATNVDAALARTLAALECRQ